MIFQLVRKLFTAAAYMQVSPERITVRNVQTGASFSIAPTMAITTGPKARILACGVEAQAHAATEGVRIVNPFGHPRTIVSDFMAGDLLVKELLRRMKAGRSFVPSPYVVMHPLGEPEGGYTEIELRALREMAHGAGASDVMVWVGRPLTDQEVAARAFQDFS